MGVQTYGFATALFEQHDFSRAITEYKRYAFLENTPEASQASMYAIACCYHYARDWQRAREAWLQLVMRFPDSPAAQEAGYRICETYVATQDYRGAGQSLTRYLENAASDSPFRDDASFLLGITQVSLHDWESGQQSYTAFAATYPKSELVDAANAVSESLPAIGQMKRKSPQVAVLLSSVVPGLGQMYAGRTRDGLTALLVNAAFIGLTANRFDRKDTTGGVVSGLMATSFYLGNIYGAGGAAESANRTQDDQAVEATFQAVLPKITGKLGHQEQLHPWTVE